MKIAHECPLSIFDEVQSVTDYDYCLVHLLEGSDLYNEKFMEAREKGREIILDNSLFELETPFDPQKFAEHIKQLRPTWYIIPDKLEDCDFTINSVKEWYHRYKRYIPYKSIGVVQGKNYEEIKKCYLEIAPLVDKVAISFDYSFFVDPDSNENKYIQYAIERKLLLARMVSEGVIDQSKPHHLLGCGVPQEFKQYRNYDWIDSVDTSNPVVHGLRWIRYKENGLDDKLSEKLHTMIGMVPGEVQRDMIFYNIGMFRTFCNG